MVIDFSRSKMLEDDFKILLNVSKHIEAHLNDILKNVKEFHGKGAKSNGGFVFLCVFLHFNFYPFA